MTEEFPCFDRNRIRLARYPYLCPIPNDSGTFEAAIARIMWALNVGTDKSLCNALGVRQSLMGTAKRRRTIPAKWLLRLQLQWNISPLWVLTGYIPPVVPGRPTPVELERLMNLIR